MRDVARYSAEHGWCPACKHRLDIHDQGYGCQVGWSADSRGCWCPLTQMSEPDKRQAIQ